MMQCIKIFALAFLSVLVTTTCAQSENSVINRDFPSGSLANQVDTSLITDIPCSPPCWYGIEPGKTSIQEAQSIVQSLPFVKKVNLFDGNELTWSSLVTDWAGGVIVFDASGNVETIRYDLEYDMKVNDLIAKQGIPESFLLFPGSSSVGEIEIFWPNSGLVANIHIVNMNFTAYETTPPIRPDSRIDGVVYSQSPMDLSKIISSHPELYFKWNNYQPIGAPTR